MVDTTKQIQKALEIAMPAIGNRIQNALVLRAPVDTGRLVNSIKVVPDKHGLQIFMVEYGKYVEFGRAPRVITPTNKKALAFKVGGKKVVVKKVKQGAVRPNPFVRETIQTKVKKIIIEELNKVLNQ